MTGNKAHSLKKPRLAERLLRRRSGRWKGIDPAVFSMSYGNVVNTNYNWYDEGGGGTMPLSGKEMLKRYLASGWEKLRQRGSHVIVGKGNERETIPMHGELKKGLEQKLLKRLGDKAKG